MSKTTKQTTENKPPAWAAPLFSQSASEATDLYNSGVGGGVYQGQTVADLSGQTMAGVNQLASAGTNAPDYGSQVAGIGQNNANLADMASGKYLQEGNPYYRQRLDSEIGDANAMINSAMSGSGRYGSGAHSGVVAKNTTNMLLQGLENDWNRNQANQLSAVGLSNQGYGQQAGLMGQQFANQLAGGQAALGAGQVVDQNQQAKLQADYSKWLAEDMQDWTRLGLLQSAAAGSAGNYGTNVQAQTQPFNVLGGIGALGSILTKSDVRLKDDIRHVGTNPYGLNVYEYRYVWSDERVTGVMAQEVAEVMPDAVVEEPDGFLAVDYGRLWMRAPDVRY